MKVILATIFVLFFVSLSFATTSSNIAGSAASSANLGGLLSGTGSASGSASISLPISGLLNLPSQYLGVLLQRATGTFGLLPAVSIVGDLNLGNLLSLGASVQLANAFAQNGATVSLNISLPTCGVLSAITKTTGLASITTPVITVVNDLANSLNSLAASITSDISIGTNLGIVCQAAPSCTIALANLRINGIKVSEDLNVRGGTINNALSVIIPNNLLNTCHFEITATLAINCNVVSATVDSLTSCKFLFELVNGVTGALGSIL